VFSSEKAGGTEGIAKAGSETVHAPFVSYRPYERGRDVESV
jgi:hypothetical protein